MNWSNGIRQFHRWMAVLFTLAVIAAFIAMSREKPIVWVSYVPLAPLLMLFLTGAYMFALPYTKRDR